MIYSAASFMAGIIAFHFFPSFPVCITLIALLLLIAFLSARYKKRRTICYVALIFISGFLYGFVRENSFPRLLIPDDDLPVTGVVIDGPELFGENLRFTVDQAVIDGQGIRGLLRLAINREYLNSPLSGIGLLPGSRISAVVKLGEPSYFRNPGVYRHDPIKNGVVASGYVKQMKFISDSRGLSSSIFRMRKKIGSMIDSCIPETSASFLKAITIGMKGGMRQEMRDRFSATGLAHLLSISGTHFGLLAFIIFRLVRAAVKLLPEGSLKVITLYVTPAQIAILCSLPVLAVYAVMSGMNTPTVRSLIMVYIYLLALFLGRRGEWLNSLSIAAIIILLYDPDTLFTLSFQLSFIAVFSIGYVFEQRERNRGDGSDANGHEDRDAGKIISIRDKIRGALILTIAAVIGTAPLIATAFKQFPLIAPVTNLIITPAVCFLILPLCIVSSFIASVLDLSFMPLGWLLDAATYSVLWLTEIFSYVPYANLRIHEPPVFITILYYPACVMLLRYRHIWSSVPIAVLLFVYLCVPYLKSDDLSITFLDVGQGEASVVRLPDRRVMLVDGGSGDADAGRRVIAPHLWSRGIREIDLLVLSHPHPDHIGGLLYILDNFEVKEVWTNGRIIGESGAFFSRAEQKKIRTRIPERGDFIDAQGYHIYLFHPYDAFHASSRRGEFSDENSDSLVMKIVSGNVSVLFTGDIEEEAEQNLLALGPLLHSSILKVPHHGSRTSSSGAFLSSVSPEVAIISSGRNNPYHHPHRECLERYREQGVHIFRTDRDGAITVTVRDGAYDIRSYQDSRFTEATNLRDEIRNLKVLSTQIINFVD